MLQPHQPLGAPEDPPLGVELVRADDRERAPDVAARLGVVDALQDAEHLPVGALTSILTPALPVSTLLASTVR